VTDLRIEQADWLLTLDAERRIFTDGAVDVEGGRIAAVGKTDEIRRRGPGAKRVISARGKLSPRWFDSNGAASRASRGPAASIVTHAVTRVSRASGIGLS